MARLLVVDRSELVAWRVAQVAPAGVDVERATTFVQAQKMLDEDPPDAVLFNLAPCHSDWRRLLDRCVGGGRSIPFLCMAAVDHYEVAACELPCRLEDVIPKGLSPAELSKKIAGLMAETGRGDASEFRRARNPRPGRPVPER